MEYVKRRIDQIRPYENNPRFNDAAVLDVAESIKQCGYIAPIVVDEAGVILAGHTRYEALKLIGVDECDVIVVSDLDDEQKRKYRLYDNKANELATWDKKKLDEELKDVDFHGYDFGQPTQDDIDMLAVDGQHAKRTKVCPCCGEEFEV